MVTNAPIAHGPLAFVLTFLSGRAFAVSLLIGTTLTNLLPMSMTTAIIIDLAFKNICKI
jgi:hypothetical protein